MRIYIIIFVLLGLSVSGCSEPLSEHEKEIQKIDRQIAATKKETKRLDDSLGSQKPPNPETATLPSYSIISDTIRLPVKKRSVDVRLENRISEIELERLGQAIRAQSPHKDPVFIMYYLPNQKVGSGAWGSTHFTPKLKTNIYGMTIKQEKDPFPNLPDGASVIAKFAGNEFMGEKTIIYKTSGGTINKVSKYKDGSGATSRLYPASNDRFDTRNDHGEYFVIKGKSVLAYDSEGLLDTYKTE